MQLHVSHEDGYTLGEAHGALDDSTGKLFRDYLYPLIEVHGTAVLLDLSACDRINSLGIGHVVNLVARANTNSSRVILVSPRPLVEGVFSVTGLSAFLEIVPTLADGLNRLTPSAGR